MNISCSIFSQKWNGYKCETYDKFRNQEHRYQPLGKECLKQNNCGDYKCSWYGEGRISGRKNNYFGYSSLLLSIIVFLSCGVVKKPYMEHYELGNQYYFNGNYEKAIYEFTEAIKLKPDFADAYVGRGNVYTELSEYILTDGDYQKAVSLNPNNAYLIDVAEYSRKGEYGNAIDELSIAINQNLNPPISYEARANAHFAKGDYDNALVDINKAITLKPDFVAAYLLRSTIYASKGDFKNTSSDLNAAIAINYDYIPAYAMRGVIYKTIFSDHNKAVSDFGKVLAKEPEYVSDYYLRGFVYFQSGEYDKAIENYNKAIVRNSEAVDLYIGRGEAYGARDNYELAINDFTKVISMQPTDTAYLYRGDLYKKYGKTELAIADYSKAIRINPNNFSAYLSRILIYLDPVETEKTVNEFASKVKTNSNSIDTAIQLINYFGIIGDKTIDDFSEAIRCAPEFSALYALRGFLYIFNENTDRAVIDLDKAADLDPASSEIQIIRQFAYELKRSDSVKIGEIRKNGYNGLSKSDIETLKTVNSIKTLAPILIILGALF
jgi:tetratricopeptide (TPR) repeat protein